MSENALISKANAAHLFPAFIAQLNKDIGVPLFTTDDKGIETLQQKLENYLSQHPEQVNEIIYRSDVNENKAKSISPEDFFGPLAVLILQRIAQKVIFRDQYSG